jgi:excinuclease ABC subunit C
VNSQDFKKIEKKLPNNPGVYFFMDGKKILYIGKATNLKDRVKSYFANDLFKTRGPKIVKMLELSTRISFQKTDSVLEALILESHLIKKQQPQYNTKEKDDKSFSYVVITDEEFPRILILRGRDILVSNLREEKLDFSIKESFGPFTSGTSLKEALKIIRKIFPFRDKCLPSINSLKKPKACFNRQIGLCPGVCSGEISKGDYGKIVKNISRFFKGEKKIILKDFQKEMKSFSKNREFEKAGEIKKKIFALNHIQDIALIKNERDIGGDDFKIESYDIAHISGSSVTGGLVVSSQGEFDKSQYRKFKIKNNPNNDDLKSLTEILERRLRHLDWPLPNLFVVDGGENQLKTFKTILNKHNIEIPVVSVVKNEKHKAREILGDKEFVKNENDIYKINEETHRFTLNYHRKLRSKV